MSALADALRHPANRPGALVRRLASIVNPAADLHGLEDGGGVFCDFAPGHEEKDPSLSADMGHGGAVFKRHGKDFEGGAVGFVAYCLGISKGEAAAHLIEWAGIVDSPPEARKGQGRPQVGRKRGTAAPSPAKEEGKKARRVNPDTVRAKLALQGPLDPEALAHALRGWQPIEAGEDTPEHAELARRGLSPALPSGVLRAYRFAGKVGPDGGPWKTYSLPRHILPGAVAFEVRGPDGAVWAVKVRNPGSKADLEAAKATRYAYLTKGGHSPAWCAPGFEEDPARPVLIVEGELNAAAALLMLEAAGQGHAYRVQGVASASAWPHLHGLEAGRVAYIYADPDTEGDAAREAWAKVCASVGATVRQVGRADGVGTHVIPFAFPSPSGSGYVTDGDACEALGRVPDFGPPEGVAAWQGARLLSALEEAGTWQPPAKEDAVAEEGQGKPGDVWLSKRQGFGIRGGTLCALEVRRGEDGRDWEAAEALANFAAYIRAEVFEEDGTGEAARVFEVEGTRPDGQPMRPARVRVTAADFGGMGWAVREWGARAIVGSGQGKKDKAREAIQHLSLARGIEERTVYTHTGWLQHAEHGPVYLTAGAVIGAAGGVSGVEVDLGPGLSAYALPDPAAKEDGSPRPVEDLRDAVRGSLALLDLAPDAVGVPILGAVYRAALGRSDFALWVPGETGRNKTAYMGLAQAHYGAGWNRHRLPEGWQSTANALEKTAHTVKDALLIVDDFKPAGSATDVSKAHGTLTRVLQGVADGAGRGRMEVKRGGSGLQRQGAHPPRGTLMSSGETLPRGHSNRARVVLVPVEKKLIHSRALSEAYYRAEDLAGGGVYALATAGYARWIAAHFEGAKVGGPAHRRMVRTLAPRFEGAHGRNGPAAADLAYGWAAFLTFAEDLGAVGQGEAAALWARVVSALEATAKGQGEHLREEDPVTRALAVLSGLLAQGRVYLEDAAGEDSAPPPEDVAPALGWQAKTWRTDSGEGVELRTRPGAVMVGYFARSGGDEWAYFLPDALHGELQRAVTAQGGAILPDPSTLFGNMKDRFYPAGLMRCEVEKGGEGKPGRVRSYYKATVRGQRGRFLALRFPIDPETYNLGTVGTMGTDGEESTSSTASDAVPTFNIFSEVLGTMGTPSSVAAPLSSPDAPRALTLEDLEDLPEGADLPGVVTL
ncbi:DUF927 domain-containing protein [Deinococcus sp. MIMF12]|uniref:DUF927 domain-containing protein n=1 Tax=Deinococcus rhizophilus TaxID=3049544 RepID=A0ABT7JDH4_9DEIO|nr:DUF927 domain-containing protein [Deinococcus rhizophilus]MDL2343095.1 DUF927 domain-containing protein [Deinococcus rhizophilus]